MKATEVEREEYKNKEYDYVSPDVDIKKNQVIEYIAVGGGQRPHSVGKVLDIITHENQGTSDFGDEERMVHADPDHPKYLILNEHTDKRQAVKRSHIMRVLKDVLNIFGTTGLYQSGWNLPANMDQRFSAVVVLHASRGTAKLTPFYQLLAKCGYKTAADIADDAVSDIDIKFGVESGSLRCLLWRIIDNKSVFVTLHTRASSETMMRYATFFQIFPGEKIRVYYASNYFQINHLPYNSRFTVEFRISVNQLRWSFVKFAARALGGRAIASHIARLGEGLARDAAAQAWMDAHGGVWLGCKLMEEPYCVKMLPNNPRRFRCKWIFNEQCYSDYEQRLSLLQVRYTAEREQTSQWFNDEFVTELALKFYRQAGASLPYDKKARLIKEFVFYNCIYKEINNGEMTKKFQ
ncbi:hypothetical protein MIR68_011709 [Amoeboaphelidium protococcarum]|nr:hypothetical protein MIR68_011709 [Amoeboaphelidium protococcarum]